MANTDWPDLKFIVVTNLSYSTVSKYLRGSNTKKIFVCFNAMQFIFGQVLGHGTTNIKISFSKLPLPWLPC